MITYELRKLWGIRYIKWMVLAVLIINGLLSYNLINWWGPSLEMPEEAVERYEKYPDRISAIIIRSEINKEELISFGGSESDYMYRYQDVSAEKYRDLLTKISYTDEVQNGWESFFNYTADRILLFALILVICTSSVVYEKDTGILPIIRTTKYGRQKIKSSKAAALLLLTVFLVLLVSAESLIIAVLKLDMSTPHNAIQSIKNFEMCPYALSIGEYYLVSIGVKLLTCCAFAVVTMVISAILMQNVLAYAAGFIVILVNYFLRNSTYLSITDYLKNGNMFTVAETYPLFERYLAVNIFDNVVDMVPFILCLYSAIIVLGLLLYALIYISRQKRVIASLERKFALFNLGNFDRQTLSIGMSEFKKVFTGKRLKIIMLLILVLKAYTVYDEFDITQSLNDSIYKQYMTYYNGEIDDDKRFELRKERIILERTLEKFPEKEIAYNNGEMDSHTYRNHLSEYRSAESKLPILERVERHVEYIDRLAEDGREAWFVYDTGWSKLFSRGFDWSLYFIILLFCIDIFLIEYRSTSSSGGFIQILRTSKHGRERTWRAKYLITLAASLIITAVWSLLEFYFLKKTYALPSPDAPVISIEAFEGAMFDGTISQFVVLYYVVRFAAVILMTLMILGSAVLFRNPIIVMFVTTSVTVIPMIMASFGASILSVIDFTYLLRSTPVLVPGRTTLICAAIYLILCVTLTIFSKRRWNK